MYGKRDILKGWPLTQEEVDALPKMSVKPNPVNALNLETRACYGPDGKEIDIFSTVETLYPTFPRRIIPAHRSSVINSGEDKVKPVPRERIEEFIKEVKPDNVDMKDIKSLIYKDDQGKETVLWER